MKHPAKMWPTRWLFDNRSEDTEQIQIIDLLTDIRNCVFIIMLFVIF